MAWRISFASLESHLASKGNLLRVRSREAAFGYWTAARACNDAETSETAENAFRRVMNYGRSRGLLPDMARQFEQDPEYLLAEGEKQYLTQQWVVCADIPHYVDQLDSVSRSLD